MECREGTAAMARSDTLRDNNAAIGLILAILKY